jgi:hypothetical protein
VSETDVECIGVDPEDADTLRVGEQIFGRVIVRVDRERNLVWVRPPGRAYRAKRWLKRIWWLVTGLVGGQ